MCVGWKGRATRSLCHVQATTMLTTQFKAFKLKLASSEILVELRHREEYQGSQDTGPQATDLQATSPPVPESTFSQPLPSAPVEVEVGPGSAPLQGELTWDKFQYLLRTTGRLEGYVPQENPLHDYAWLANCTNDCVYYGLAFSDEFVETAQHCTLLDPLGSVLARRKHVAPNWGQSAQVPSQLLRQDQPRHPGQIGCRLLQAGRPEKLRDKGRPPFSCKKLMASCWALALGSPTRPFGLSCLTSQPAQVPRLAAGLLAFYSSRHEEQG